MGQNKKLSQWKKNQTYLVEVVVVAGVEILEDLLAHIELAGGALGNHVDPTAGGDLAEGADASELPRAMSLLQVPLPFQVVLIVFVHSAAVAEAIVADHLHRAVVAVGLQAIDGLVVSVGHRALRASALTRLLDEVMVTEVRVGVLSSMKPVDLILPIRNHVRIAIRTKDLESLVLRNLELDLDALAVVT